MVLQTLSAIAVLIAKAGGTVIFLFLARLITKAIYNVYFHPLSKYPGPKLYAASSLPNTWMLVTGVTPQVVKGMHEKYGHVVRMAPNELVYSDAAAQKDIYTKRPQMAKSTVYYNSPPTGGHSILTVKSDKDHGRYRRLLSHAFSEKALREQEPLIMKYIDLLITRLHSRAKTGESLDMVAWYNYVSFDIIGDLTLGSSFDCLESTNMHPWVSFLFRNFKAAAYRSAARRFSPLDEIFKSMIPQKLLQGRVKLALFTKEKVEARMSSNTDRKDFMTNIMKHNDTETGMTKEEIIPTFNIILIAGSETTATLLSVVTYQLLKHPDIMNKLVAEIRTTFKNEDEIDMVSVNQLRYELAVLEEGLRIQPPVPLGSPRTVPDGGQMISGEWVPGGTTVFVSAYSAHLQPRNWKDADKFIPERWLGGAEYENDNRGAFAPFSLGPRNCIGRNLAYAEMRVILARILWNFDLELAEQSRTWGENMKMYFLWEKPELFVKLTPVIR